jgi:hypothetical protein
MSLYRDILREIWDQYDQDLSIRSVSINTEEYLKLSEMELIKLNSMINPKNKLKWLIDDEVEGFIVHSI